ncbi:MAG: response regulator [bacterium]
MLKPYNILDEFLSDQKLGTPRPERILIVDDDRFVGRSLEVILEKEGYEVHIATSGEQALEILKKDTFDLVLTDLMMPNVDGLDILQQVKKSDRDTVVIILTAHSSTETAIKGMKQGAFDYLCKPCSNDVIRMTVRRGLEKRQFEREKKAIAQEIERRAVELAELNSIANIVGSSLNLDKILKEALLKIIKIFNADDGYFAILNERNSTTATYRAVARFYNKSLGQRFNLDNRCVCGLSKKRKGIIQTYDFVVQNKAIVQHCWGPEFRSSICVPLGTRGKVLGLLNLAIRKERIFSEHECDLLWAVANQVAMAIENAQLFQKVKSMIESMAEGVILLDSDYRIAIINPAARTLLKLINKSSKFNFLKKLGKIRITEIVQHSQDTKQSKKPIEILTEDEPHQVISVSSSDVRGLSGEHMGYVIVLQDITELYNAQEQLYLASRLASIGELASGIAHEINNPLTSILGFAQLMLMDEINEETRYNLQKIYDEGLRTKGIVNNLLGFARNHKGKREIININSLINTVINLFGKQPELYNIQLILDLGENLPLIHADPGQLQQVFLNIIQNAYDVLLHSNKGSIIKITTKPVKSQYVRVEIQDDGPGMSEEVKKKIFNPFFTTKDVGQGTGLGLSICHKIIQSHGGSISVQSQLNKGANFVIELPVYNEKMG